MHPSETTIPDPSSRFEGAGRTVPCLLLACALALAGCGGGEDPVAVEEGSKVQGGEYSIPELRFAGAHAIYVLRRIAAEAGLLMVLDEVRTPGLGSGNDLAWEHVDIDLPAGPLGPALEAVRETTPAFDYRVANGVLFVRTARALAQSKTEFDFPILPHTQVEADLPGFTRWLMEQRPMTFLRVNKTRGEPVYRRVEVTIPADSTVMEAILLFAAAVDRGLHLRRGGYEYKQSMAGIPEGAKAVVSSELSMWRPLDEPAPIPRRRNAATTLRDAAELSEKHNVPITVLDRTALGGALGSLVFGPNKILDGLDLPDALERLRERYDGPDHFTWTENDGVYEIVTTQFEYFLTGRDLYEAELVPGVFEGTIQDLARWVNVNRKQPDKRRIWAGEYVVGDPTARIEITEGMLVKDLLHAFAKQTGLGWYYVSTAARTPEDDTDAAWSGARLSLLREWGPNGRVKAMF